MTNLSHLTDTEIRSLLWRYSWFVDVKIEAYKRGMVGISSISSYVLNGYGHKVKTDFSAEAITIEQTVTGPTADPNTDISAESVIEDKELITQTLAQIYLQQGLKAKAIDTYRQLILKYPKKSVYFASLISDIENNY